MAFDWGYYLDRGGQVWQRPAGEPDLGDPGVRQRAKRIQRLLVRRVGDLDSRIVRHDLRLVWRVQLLLPPHLRNRLTADNAGAVELELQRCRARLVAILGDGDGPG